MRLSFYLIIAGISTVLSSSDDALQPRPSPRAPLWDSRLNARTDQASGFIPRPLSASQHSPLRYASSGSSIGSIPTPESPIVSPAPRPASPAGASSSRALFGSAPGRPASIQPALDKNEQKAYHAEQMASMERGFYRLTANDFRKKYSTAYSKYESDKKDPSVPPEKLYQDRRGADKMFKTVGAAQKDLANAYAKASHFAGRAGMDDRAVRNDKKAKATAAHFYATQATYRLSKDALRSQHLPEIANNIRAQAGSGASFKASRLEAAAQKASERLHINQYVMHKNTKNWRTLRKADGRDTESDVSDDSVDA